MKLANLKQSWGAMWKTRSLVSCLTDIEISWNQLVKEIKATHKYLASYDF